MRNPCFKFWVAACAVGVVAGWLVGGGSFALSAPQEARPGGTDSWNLLAGKTGGGEFSAAKKATLTSSSPWKAVTDAFHKGVDKVSDAFTPPSRSERTHDPVSLAAKGKPSPDLHLAAARMAEETGNLPEAEAQYQRALKLDSKHAPALVEYARFKDRRGDLDEAVELYQRAARVSPQDASTFNDMGLCLARQRNYPDAIVALKRATVLDPKKWLYRNNIAMVLVEMGQVDAAVSHLTAVQEPAVAYYNVGYILQKKGDRAGAAGMFAKALGEKPSLAEARIWLERLSRPEAPTGGPAPRLARDSRASVRGPAAETPSPLAPASPVAPVPSGSRQSDFPRNPPAAPSASRVAPLPPVSAAGRPLSSRAGRGDPPVVHPLPLPDVRR